VIQMISSLDSKVRYIPQRTCVGCREVKARRELIRLVRSADSEIEIDIGGKKTGRGAYLCASRQCWDNGIKSGRLERALRVTLAGYNREQLLEYGRERFQGVN
jgi:predicted RNA-binding protein YlxR (DUF448 family)